MKPVLIATLSLLIASTASFAQAEETNKTASEDTVIAVVLGKNISTKEKDKLRDLIFGALLEKYAKDNNIAPTEAEINAFVSKTEEMEKKAQIKLEKERKKLLEDLQSPALSKEKKDQMTSQLKMLDRTFKIGEEAKQRTKGLEAQMLAMKVNIAKRFVQTWKINKSLFNKYGGRVIFQQAGPEPLDAYLMFLKEEEKGGSFQILNKDFNDPFWKYFTEESMHTFYPKEEAVKAMNTPWWLMEVPDN